MSKVAKSVVLGACVLALIGWVLSLAGTGRLTQICNNRGFSADACGRTHQYEWWGLWFTFIIALALLIITAMNKLYDEMVMMFLALCAACLSVTMFVCRDAIATRGTLHDDGGDDEGKSANDASLAGFLLMSIALMSLILALPWARSVFDHASHAHGTTAHVSTLGAKASKGNAPVEVVTQAAPVAPAPVVHTTVTRVPAETYVVMGNAPAGTVPVSRGPGGV